jgi:hypothetical protein
MLFHMLCEDDSQLLPGPCQSQARWLGPDGKKRCSLHHIQRFGHSEPLVRVEGYEPPKTPDDTPAEEPAEEPVST